MGNKSPNPWGKIIPSPKVADKIMGADRIPSTKITLKETVNK